MTIPPVRTIRDEISQREISRVYFDKVYNHLKEKKQLPNPDIVPWKQYNLIIDYLRDKQVLGKRDKLLKEGLRLFDAKRALETMMETTEDELPMTKSSGGIVACRDRDHLKGNGGIVYCRDDY